MKFVPCATWIRRNAAKAVPDKVKLDKEEIEHLIGLNSGHKQSSDDENEGDDIEAKYKFDDYDDEETEENNTWLSGLACYADNADDPNLGDDNDNDSDESDREDYTVKPDDNLLAVCKVEDDAAIIEVYVYNADNDDCYVHHDYLLRSIPLSIAWLSFNPHENDRAGNFVATAGFGPKIDIWDLDVVDGMEPLCSLKQTRERRKEIKKATEIDYAVIDLAWNNSIPNLMVSSDTHSVVTLWDLADCSIASTLTPHKQNIQSMDWHPFEKQILLTGSSDKKVALSDCRTLERSMRWKIGNEIEKVVWNKNRPFTCLAGDDSGKVYELDTRVPGSIIWTLAAHSADITSLLLPPGVPNMLVTGSVDKTIKVWDVSEKPSFIHQINSKVGKVYCVESCPDVPTVLCVGGDKKDDNMAVIDLTQFSAVVNRFSPSVPVKLEGEDSGVTVEGSLSDGATATGGEPTKKKKLRQVSGSGRNIKKPKVKKSRMGKHKK